MSSISAYFGAAAYPLFGEGENIVFSPLSIAAAMGMVAIGARRETRLQILEVLGLRGAADSQIVAALKGLAAARPTGAMELKVANRVYAEQAYPFGDDYLHLVEQVGGLERVDFAHQAEQVRQAINQWVEQQTRKIRDLLPPNSLDRYTTAILVNALYFKAMWQTRFPKARTQNAEFHKPGGRVTVPMMTLYEATLGYAATSVYKAALLRYVDPKFAYIAWVPQKGVELRDVEDAVLGDFERAIRIYERAAVTVVMPRHALKYGTVELSKPLGALGVTDAFDEKAADFSGMTGEMRRRLWLKAVFHQAFLINVEEGSEGGAATAAVVTRECCTAAPDPVEVRLNRPYMFAVVNLSKGEVIFLGRVTDPSANNDLLPRGSIFG